MNESNALNPAAVERLVRLGGTKFTVEMLGLFLSYGAQKLAEARQARAAGNLAALAAAVHPLKSSAGNVGAVQVQELAVQVEQSARNQQAELAMAQLDDLERAFASASSLLEVEKTRLANTPIGA